MLYKIRHHPNSVLAVTLKPREKLYVSLGSVIRLESGLVIQPTFGGGFLRALLRCWLGQDNLTVNTIQNPGTSPRSLSLGKALPGEMVRVELPKGGLVINPATHIAHTSGVNMGLYWLGFSSWLAGQGLVGPKLQGHGRVFLSGYGSLVQQTCSQSFVVEHSRLMTISPKLKLRANFPKAIIGDAQSGTGLSSCLRGTGTIHWQSRSLSGLGRYVRLKLR